MAARNRFGNAYGIVQDPAHAQAVCLQFARVAIDLDLTRRGAVDAHRTHAVDTGQRGRHLVVQDLVQARERLVGRGRQDHDRHVVGAEFEDDGHRGAVRQLGVDHVQFVPDIVGRLLDVDAILEFQGQDADVLLRPGGQFLEVRDAVQRVLQELRQVLLDVRGAGSLVGRHHHDDVGVELRELGDRSPREREDAEDHEGDEDQRRRDRMLYRTSVDAHTRSSLDCDLGAVPQR